MRPLPKNSPPFVFMISIERRMINANSLYSVWKKRTMRCFYWEVTSRQSITPGYNVYTFSIQKELGLLAQPRGQPTQRRWKWPRNQVTLCQNRELSGQRVTVDKCADGLLSRNGGLRSLPSARVGVVIPLLCEVNRLIKCKVYACTHRVWRYFASDLKNKFFANQWA